jgi:maleate isomerase
MYKELEKIYGTTAKIGLIYIASSWVMEPEFYLMSPPGVITCTTRISLGDTVTEESLLSLGDQACNAAELLAESPMDVIALGCTSGSFIGGSSYDLELIKKMEQKSSTKCTTTGRSVIDALKAMELDRLALFTPYTDDITDRAVSYLRENNIETISRKGLGLTRDYDIDMVPLETVKKEVLALRDLSKCNGIFISCTGLKTAPIIAELEKLTGLPVITSVQATFWNCLKISGVQDTPGNFGSLFNL